MAGLNVHIGPAVATRITRSLRVTFSEQLANLGQEEKIATQSHMI